MKFSLVRTFEGFKKACCDSSVLLFINFLKKVVSLFSLLWLCPLSLRPCENLIDDECIGSDGPR